MCQLVEKGGCEADAIDSSPRREYASLMLKGEFELQADHGEGPELPPLDDDVVYAEGTHLSEDARTILQCDDADHQVEDSAA